MFDALSIFKVNPRGRVLTINILLLLREQVVTRIVIIVVKVLVTTIQYAINLGAAQAIYSTFEVVFRSRYDQLQAASGCYGSRTYYRAYATQYTSLSTLRSLLATSFYCLQIKRRSQRVIQQQALCRVYRSRSKRQEQYTYEQTRSKGYTPNYQRGQREQSLRRRRQSRPSGNYSLQPLRQYQIKRVDRKEVTILGAFLYVRTTSVTSSRRKLY